jgi:hypothetical protein
MRGLTVGLVSFFASVAIAGTVPDYDFDWATIGDVGNAGLGETPGEPYMAGRGSVDHRYRISKLEITTGQWMEYVNTFATQSNEHFDFGRPLNWGAEIDPTYDGQGRRWRLRDVAHAARLPVTSLTWRQAAQYCNWLHNGKQSNFQSLVTGAYDSTTWGGNARDGFTDQADHLLGAKFWIPTLDEWMKAVYYDPHKNGKGEGGWWLHPNGSDTPLVSGLPGEGGETSGGLDLDPHFEVWRIPLGAYSDVVTPWGLWDASGGSDEWTESYFDDFQFGRVFFGSWAGATGWQYLDQAWTLEGAGSPNTSNSTTGFRIASVPGPPALIVSGCFGIYHTRRQRRILS